VTRSIKRLGCSSFCVLRFQVVCHCAVSAMGKGQAERKSLNPEIDPVGDDLHSFLGTNLKRGINLPTVVRNFPSLYHFSWGGCRVHYSIVHPDRMDTEIGSDRSCLVVV
jgi:hypothetical protein